MSTGERDPLPTGGLQGSRTRSYGSLVQSPLSPARPRRIEHQVQPGDTLQGLSLKYGVSMEEIKRRNRLYTNDSIFLKKYLSIHVPSVPNTSSGLVLPEKDSPHAIGNSNQNGKLVSNHGKKRDTEEGTSELSPMDFLKRMDSVIRQSKEAAVKRCQEGEKSFAYLEAACASRTPDRRITRSQSATSASRMHQEAILGAVPLTITKHTKKLREREDDIFEL